MFYILPTFGLRRTVRTERELLILRQEFTNPKETALSDSMCKICGDPAPSGMRYCKTCDFQQRNDGGGTRADKPARESSRSDRGSLSIFLLVFLVAAGGTVGMGVTATPGLSIPSLKATLGIGAPAENAETVEWGEIRTVNTRVRIRADRSTDSDIVGMIETGEKVRAHFLENGWYAVFDTDIRVEDASAAIGYVYAPLLKPALDDPATSESG